MPRSGGEKRGNSADRRARKQWMLRVYGDGTTAPCVHCRKPLTIETIEADRIVPGGPYHQNNVQPACRNCNQTRGNDESWIGPNPYPPLQILLDKMESYPALVQLQEENQRLMDVIAATKAELRQFEHVDGEELYETAAVAAMAFNFAKHRADALDETLHELTGR
jgi:hypothetical protein